MTATLARLIVDANLETRERAGRRWIAPDQVVLDERDGAFALEALRQAGGDAARSIYAMFALDRRGVAIDPADPSAPVLEREARAAGLHVARAGLGRCENVHAERCAAPGRLAVGCARELALGGALGMLMLRVSRLEAAAALGAGALPFELPPVRIVRLVGSLVPGVTGDDVAIHIAQHLADDPAPAVLELLGSGVERLTMADRFALCRSAWLRAAAVLLPSDEGTRAWMRAHGREHDWKRLAVDGLDIEADLEIELESVEPALGRATRAPRLVRHAAGSPVRRVVIGPRADYAEWVRLAAVLDGRTPVIDVLVVPGSRRIVDTARARGLWETLAARGVRFEWQATAGLGDARALVLECGAGAEVEGAWSASVETCAAAAVTGAITDPRELTTAGAPLAGAEDMRYEVAGAIAPPERGDRTRTPVATPRLARRGVVLGRLRDDASAAAIVPWGPRRESAPAAALADHAMGGVDPAFRARARDLDGGWLAAGRGFLAGERADLAAWILARCGVRATFASSYAPGAVAHLARAGVLPLETPSVLDVDPGTELELPAGWEAIEPGAPVTVRDLTHGGQALAAHRLDDAEIEWIRAGGLVAFAARGEG